LLLFGIWTTARAWNVHNVLDHAAREAARYGAVDPDNSAIEAIAQGELVAAAFPWADVDYCSTIIDGATVTSTDPLGPCLGAALDPTTDDRVQVELVVDPYQLDFVFFDINVTLTARAVSRLEP
jgi:hypothetical protein